MSEFHINLRLNLCEIENKPTYTLDVDDLIKLDQGEFALQLLSVGATSDEAVYNFRQAIDVKKQIVISAIEQTIKELESGV